MASQDEAAGPSIAMWGAPGTGKTTFLAALSFALNRQQTGWNVAGADQTSSRELAKLTDSLDRERAFPKATEGISQYRWVLNGHVTRTIRRRFSTERRGEPVSIPLDLVDSSGEIVGPDHFEVPDQEELIEHLVRSRGIVFMFDPIREFEEGDAFRHTFGVLVQLAGRLASIPGAVGGRLPHHIAVCITKFDDIRVLETAQKLDLLTVDPADPYEFPRVHDDDARELFVGLCQISRSGNAEMVPHLLEQYFLPGRVRYFVTSAIGFYVDSHRRVYDGDDPLNLLPDDSLAGKARIRGAVRPINVVEPLLWLGRKVAEQGATGG